MRSLIIYHANCLDGFGAAYLTHGWFAIQGVLPELIPANYGDAPPNVEKGDQLEIVDFSYPRETLIDMHDKAAYLRVIDHHKTAQANCDGLDFCKFDMDRSACRIVWDEICGGEPPWWVAYIEDRDLWRKSLPHCDEVSAYLRTVPHTLEDWERAVVNTTKDAAIAAGTTIRSYQLMLVRDALAKARDVVLDGHEIRAVNYTAEYSEIAGELATGRPFGAVWFTVGEYAVFSLRSRDGGIDVSEFAAKHGGGGHTQAAGFRVRMDRLGEIMQKNGVE